MSLYQDAYVEMVIIFQILQTLAKGVLLSQLAATQLVFIIMPPASALPVLRFA